MGSTYMLFLGHAHTLQGLTNALENQDSGTEKRTTNKELSILETRQWATFRFSVRLWAPFSLCLNLLM